MNNFISYEKKQYIYFICNIKLKSITNKHLEEFDKLYQPKNFQSREQLLSKI